MNKARLRLLFDELKADLRDYYDAQRDVVEAQRHLMTRAADIVAELATDDGGVVGKGEGVTVMRPPNVHELAHAWDAGGRCVVHEGCQAFPPCTVNGCQNKACGLGQFKFCDVHAPLCPVTSIYVSRCTHCGAEPLNASVAAPTP